MTGHAAARRHPATAPSLAGVNLQTRPDDAALTEALEHLQWHCSASRTDWAWLDPVRMLWTVAALEGAAPDWLRHLPTFSCSQGRRVGIVITGQNPHISRVSMAAAESTPSIIAPITATVLASLPEKTNPGFGERGRSQGVTAMGVVRRWLCARALRNAYLSVEVGGRSLPIEARPAQRCGLRRASGIPYGKGRQFL